MTLAAVVSDRVARARHSSSPAQGRAGAPLFEPDPGARDLTAVVVDPARASDGRRVASRAARPGSGCARERRGWCRSGPAAPAAACCAQGGVVEDHPPALDAPRPQAAEPLAPA